MKTHQAQILDWDAKWYPSSVRQGAQISESRTTKCQFVWFTFSFSATKQKRNKWELKSPGRFSQEARFQHWFWMEEQFSQPKCGSELGSDALPWERNAKSRAFLFCFWAWSVMKWRVGFKVGLLFVTWWIYKIGHWDIIMGLKLGRAGLD